MKKNQLLAVGNSVLTFEIDDVVNDDIVFRVPRLAGVWTKHRFIEDLISHEEDKIYKGPYDRVPNIYYIVNSDVFLDIKDAIEGRRAWYAEQETIKKAV